MTKKRNKHLPYRPTMVRSGLLLQYAVMAMLFMLALAPPMPFSGSEPADEMATPYPDGLSSRACREEEPLPFEIELRSRTITQESRKLSPGELPHKADGPAHIIVKFSRIPGESEREVLSETGLELLFGGYLHDSAWLASVRPDRLTDVLSHPLIEWIGGIEPRDRISPALKTYMEGGRPRPEWFYEGRPYIRISFFSDTEEADARKVLGEHVSPLAIGPWDRLLNGCTISVDPWDAQVLKDLSREDPIQWMEPAAPSSRDVEELDYSRPEVGVDLLYQLPYDLRGRDVPVMIYDSSSVRDSHLGLAGRVHLTDPKGPSSEWNRTPENHTHATAVAGVLCGNGDPVEGRDLRGMAPEAELYSYWKISFNTTEGESAFDDAINDRRVHVSHNSWGKATSSGGPACVDPRFTEDDGFGDYNDYCRWFDMVATGGLNDPGNLRVPLIVFSAGNYRNAGTGGTDPQHPEAVNFGTLNVPKTAKNVLVVGATYDDDGDPDTITTYGEDAHTELYAGSCWGPCDDGRLKPELMAPGGTYSHFPGPGGDDNINTTDGTADDAYLGKLATSVAAPHVSGAAALLVEHHIATFGEEPAPDTLKALLIQGAEDIVNIDSLNHHLDGYRGPDYMTGYGLLRARESAQIISDDAVTPGLMERGELENGGMEEYSVLVSDQDPRLKVTLVWNDEEPGTPNDGSKELVNDLDILLLDPDGNEHYPYTLDPSDPISRAGTDGPDRLNNVEQVEVRDPSGGWWKVRLTGHSVPSIFQPYALISDLPLRVELPPVVRISYPNGGELLNGTETVVWTASDPNSDELSIEIWCGDGTRWDRVADNLSNTGTYPWNTTNMTDGEGYFIRVKAVDDSVEALRGEDTSNGTFTVDNPDPPGARILDPVPGEVLAGNSTIRWESWDPDGDDVDVELTYGPGGGNWSAADGEPDGNNAFLWDTTGVEDGQYYLSLLCTDSSPGSLVNRSPEVGPVHVDNPDPPLVRVLSPNGGERAGGVVDVIWYAIDPDGDNMDFNVYFRQGSNDSWRRIAAGLRHSGEFQWDTVSVPDGGGYMIMVEAIDDSQGRLIGRDQSNSSFEIYNPDPPVISNLSVGTGKILAGTVDIRWDVHDPDLDGHTASVAHRSGGGEWVFLAENVSDMTGIRWDTVQVADGEGHEVMVSVNDTSAFTLGDSVIIGPLEVYNPDPPVVTLDSPEPGNILEGNVIVSWSASDADGDRMQFEFSHSRDGGPWMVASHELEDADTFEWDTREAEDGTGYRLRVIATDLSQERLSSHDIADGTFEIYNPDPPVVTIEEPYVDTTVSGLARIRWNATDADGDTLRISIYVRRLGDGDDDEDDEWREIAFDRRNNGVFDWDTTGFPDGKYEMKVSANDGALLGESVLIRFRIGNEDGAPWLILLLISAGLVLGIVIAALLLVRRSRGRNAERTEGAFGAAEAETEGTVLVAGGAAGIDAGVTEGYPAHDIAAAHLAGGGIEGIEFVIDSFHADENTVMGEPSRPKGVESEGGATGKNDDLDPWMDGILIDGSGGTGGHVNGVGGSGLASAYRPDEESKGENDANAREICETSGEKNIANGIFEPWKLS